MVMNEALYNRMKATDWLAKHGDRDKREAYEQDAREEREALLTNVAEWVVFYTTRVTQEAEKVRNAPRAEATAKHVQLLRENAQLLQKLIDEACDLLGQEDLEAITQKAMVAFDAVEVQD